MEYVIIYEFLPKSFQIYQLLVPIIIIVFGIIGYRSIRKQGFINIFIMKISFNQDFMNKIMEVFFLIIIVFGSIGLGSTLVQMPRQLRFERELDNSNNSNSIEIIEISIPSSTSIYDKIRLKENLIINGQEFVFAKTENIKGYDWPHDLKHEELTENRTFRISYIILNSENIILKIENKTTSANKRS